MSKSRIEGLPRSPIARVERQAGTLDAILGASPDLIYLCGRSGEFLFANFSDEITTDGYMETFMDWPLILRSASDMWDIINASVDKNHVDAEVYYGSNRNIVYGRIRRRGDLGIPA